MTVGGRTALELQGYAHYLSQQLKEVHLYGVKRLPGWLFKLQRLSVDIDLTYLPVAPRSESLAAITAAMERIAQRIESGIPGARITFGRAENAMTKLVVRADSVQIKIEVTLVLRGTVNQPERRPVAHPVTSMA